ncbi:MAG TPA: hypothetical protein VFV66_10035 [Nonomuraea sp.]|nr:hypothetical protein [Nonomuraea sp.]
MTRDFIGGHMAYGATSAWQPASAGLGGQQGQQGQQMVPADAVGAILDIALKHGPGVLKTFLDLFSTQQGMAPASYVPPNPYWPGGTHPRCSSSGLPLIIA